MDLVSGRCILPPILQPLQKLSVASVCLVVGPQFPSLCGAVMP